MFSRTFSLLKLIPDSLSTIVTFGRQSVNEVLSILAGYRYHNLPNRCSHKLLRRPVSFVSYVPFVTGSKEKNIYFASTVTALQRVPSPGLGRLFEGLIHTCTQHSLTSSPKNKNTPLSDTLLTPNQPVDFMNCLTTKAQAVACFLEAHSLTSSYQFLFAALPTSDEEASVLSPNLSSPKHAPQSADFQSCC